MEENLEGDKKNTFSIVIPTCGRPNLTIRAIQSIQGQLYKNWELIVVEDGSAPEHKEYIEKYIKSQKDKRIKLLHHEVRMQRLMARNTGMKEAKNEWMCHLDSDDEYARTYLNSMNWAINENPDYDVFHFGAFVATLRNYKIREPINIQEEGEGMEKFRSGSIGLGSFVYKRSLHNEIGYFPETGSPYNFADDAKDEFPEMLEWYGPKDRSLVECKTLGNPWGDDWYLFYKLTRKRKSKMLPFLTYFHYIRRGGFLDQDDDKILNRNNIGIA